MAAVDNLALTVALLSPPSLACLVSGNVSLLLVFAVAVMWAYRDRPWISGAALGLALAVKLWLWPLAAFLLFTRRWRALGVAACWVAVAMLAWWLVSPGGDLDTYPERSEAIFEFFSVSAMGVVAALTNLGVGAAAAQGVATTLGLAVLAVAWRVRREGWVFGGCVTAALLAAPLLWTHYYAVLFVPIAMLGPLVVGLARAVSHRGGVLAADVFGSARGGSHDFAVVDRHRVVVFAPDRRLEVPKLGLVRGVVVCPLRQVWGRLPFRCGKSAAAGVRRPATAPRPARSAAPARASSDCPHAVAPKRRSSRELRKPGSC